MASQSFILLLFNHLQLSVKGWHGNCIILSTETTNRTTKTDILLTTSSRAAGQCLPELPA